MSNSTNSATTSSESNLKRVLGFKEVLSIAMGQTIGSGIMAMMGTAIAMTGRGLYWPSFCPLSLLCSWVFPL